MRCVGHEAEERRLLQLHGQSLSQCFVEHRVARPIREVGEDDHVLVGESRGGLEIEIRRGEQRQHRLRRRPTRVCHAFWWRVTPASSRCNSATDCHRRPGSSSRHRLAIFSSFREGKRLLRAADCCAGEHFVEDAAERIDVRARIGRFAFPLLWCHVARRAHHRAAGRDRLILARSRQPEIQHLDAGWRDHDVARFEIAVNDVLGVRLGQCSGNLGGIQERRVHRERSAFAAVPLTFRPPPAP